MDREIYEIIPSRRKFRKVWDHVEEKFRLEMFGRGGRFAKSSKIVSCCVIEGPDSGWPSIDNQ
jgi:hypothetical protein